MGIVRRSILTFSLCIFSTGVFPAVACGPQKTGRPCPGVEVAGLGATAGVQLGGGNPINVVTGNKHQREVDLPALPGVLGLEIVRHYNSADSGIDSPNGILGRGWKLSYETRLFAGATSIQIVQADGAGIIFERNPDDPSQCANADPMRGRIDIHKSDLGTEYIWRWSGGRKLHFDQDGKLQKIVETGGETLSLHYEPGGDLVRITDPQLRSMDIRRGGAAAARAGRFSGVDTIEAPTGRYVYHHGSELPAGAAVGRQKVLANLTRVDLPTAYARSAEQRRTNTPGDTTSALSRVYHYEDARFPTLLTGIGVTGAGSDGTRTRRRLSTFAYDHNGLAIRSTRWTAASTVLEDVKLDFSEPGITQLTTEDGKSTRYRHAIVGGQYRLLQVQGDGCRSCGEPNVAYRYDDLGRLLETIRLDAAGRPRDATVHQLDRHGRTLATGKLVYRDGVAQPPTWLARFEYPDAAPGAAVSDKPLLIARPSVVAGREASTRLDYNADGQLLTVTEDGWRPSPDAAEAPTPIRRIQRYTYTTIADQNLLAQYDGPLPNGPASSPDDSDITRYRYDGRTGMPDAIEQPMKRRTTFEYDDAGRIAAVNNSFDAVRRRTTYGYAPNGQLRQRIEQPLDAAQQPSAASRTTTFTHNADDQLTAVDWPDDKRTTLAYDPAGRPDDIHLPDGRTLAFPTPPDADANEESLRAVHGPPGSIAEREVLQLHANGTLALRLLDDFGRIVAIANPRELWQRATHDAAGRLLELTDPRGARTRQTFDLANRVTEIRRFAPDANETEETLRYTWNGPYRTEAAVFNGGNAVHRIMSSYTDWGQLSAQRAIIGRADTAGGPVTLGQQMRYGSDGRLISRTLPNGERIAYRYYAHDPKQPDAANRLAAIEKIGWPEAMDWLFMRLPDRWQPRMTLARLAPPVPVDKGARTTAEAEVESGLAEEEIEDQRVPSLLKSRIVTQAGPLQLKWNAAGRLVRVEKPGGAEVATYTYDAAGRRASKHTQDGTEYYFHDGAQLIATATRANGALTTAASPAVQYIYQGYRPVAWIKRSTSSGFWQAFRNSIGWPAWAAYSIETDHRGAVVSTHRIDGDQAKAAWAGHLNAWGKANPTGDPHLDPGLRLVNQYADKESGLHYNIARYYDPSRGRFISPDPAGVADTIDGATPDRLKLDVTAYVSGRPLEFFDPGGNAKITYFAVTTDEKGNQLGDTQGFTKARWSFVVDEMRDGGDHDSTVGVMRNEYARDGTSVLVDPGGTFAKGFNAVESIKTPDGNGIRWDAGSRDDVVQSFKNHYGENLISIKQFVINDVDDDVAARLIWYMTSTLEDRRRCNPLVPGWLPDIRFEPGDADIKVTNASAHGANKQRILNCNRPTSLPLKYKDDEERRRIEKYEAAAELQESPPKSAIYRDCTENVGCRSRTDITVNGHTYYASYGRTQFVVETFLRTLVKNVVKEADVPASTKESLGFNQEVSMPNGKVITMGDLVSIALRRAEKAGQAYKAKRAVAGKGVSIEKAEAAWKSMSAKEQSDFKVGTGLDKAEFIDMLVYRPSGRARTEAEGANAFAAEAAMRVLDGSGKPVFKDWLLGLFKSTDNYGYVSRRFLQSNLKLLQSDPQVAEKLNNGATTGSEEARHRQREIEEDLAARVAVLHNSGDPRLVKAEKMKLPTWIKDYANEFVRVAGRGDWESLRCTDDLSARAGIELQKLELK